MTEGEDGVSTTVPDSDMVAALTPHMIDLLVELRDHGPLGDDPGRRRTMEALWRRGLADSEGRRFRMRHTITEAGRAALRIRQP